MLPCRNIFSGLARQIPLILDHVGGKPELLFGLGQLPVGAPQPVALAVFAWIRAPSPVRPAGWIEAPRLAALLVALAVLLAVLDGFV